MLVAPERALVQRAYELDGLTQYFSADSAAPASETYTLGCIYKADSPAGGESLISFADVSSSVEYVWLAVAPTQLVRVIVRTLADGQVIVDAGGTPSDGVWRRVLVTINSGAISIRWDGTTPVTDTYVSHPTCDVFRIGALTRSTGTGSLLAGSVGFAAIASRVFSDDEQVAWLNTRRHPGSRGFGWDHAWMFGDTPPGDGRIDDASLVYDRGVAGTLVNATVVGSAVPAFDREAA